MDSPAASLRSEDAPLRVFVSYASRDRAHRDKLLEHLAPLARTGRITWWCDLMLVPGEPWEERIVEELEAADIVLLLLSAAFVRSDFCYTRELRDAQARARTGRALLIPILVEPFDVAATDFGAVELLPTKARAVSSWSNVEEAWQSVAQGIRHAVERRRAGHVDFGVGAPIGPAVPAAPGGEPWRLLVGLLRGIVENIDAAEAWTTSRYTDVEGELSREVEVDALHAGRWPWARAPRRVRRRESSLLRALAATTDELLVLEGPPGSGKSVSLRHLARAVARAAADGDPATAPLPLYVSGRDFVVPTGQAPTPTHVRSFLLTSLRREESPYLDATLPTLFDQALRAGRWVILFDSFDEIPAVLSSTQADDAVNAYAAAIAGLVRETGCRVVVASRPYRRPKGLPARIEIQPLSPARRLELVQRRLPGEPALAAGLSAWLGAPGCAIDPRLSENPLFLSLVSEHVLVSRAFPENAHEVFETFVERRLARDAERLTRRFGLAAADVRGAAEAIAFAMADDPELGLEPTVDALARSVAAREPALGSRLGGFVRALDETRLVGMGTGGTVRFAHRRFQEYFATCVLMHDPGLVPAERLVGDGRWREAAVTLLAMQPLDAVGPLLQEAGHLLDQEPPASEGLFPWPDGLLHVLGILQDGLGARVPPALQEKVDRWLVAGSERSLPDRIWALEVAGAGSPECVTRLVREALASPSLLVKDAALRQAARLPALTEEMRGDVRRYFVDRMFAGRLSSQAETLGVYVARLREPGTLADSLRVLTWAPVVDEVLFLAWAVASTVGIAAFSSQKLDALGVAAACVVLVAGRRWVWSHAGRGDGLRPTGPMLRDAVVMVIAPWMGLAVFGVTFAGAPTLTLVLLVGLPTTALWAPCAVATAAYGHSAPTLLWPILPPLYAGRVLRRLPGALPGALGALRRLPPLIGAALGALVIVGGPAMLVNLVAPDPVKIGLLVLVVAVLVLAPAWLVVAIVSERRRLDAWRAGGARDGATILGLLSGLVWYRLAALSELGKGPHDPSAGPVLEALLLACEAGARELQRRQAMGLLDLFRADRAHWRTAPPRPAPPAGPLGAAEARAWVHAMAAHEPTAFAWGPDAVDELARLVRQLRERGEGPGSPAA